MKEIRFSKLVLEIALGIVFAFLILACIVLVAMKTAPRVVSAPESTNTVVITSTNTPVLTRTPRPTYTPRPTSTPQYGTKRRPVKLGDTILLGDSKGYYLEITIVDVFRGHDAWLIVESDNMFNNLPSDDMEYIVAEVEISYTRVIPEEGEIFELSDIYWKIMTNGQLFGWDEPDFVCCFGDSETVIGETSKTMIVRQVFIEDEDPLLILFDKFFFETR